MDKGDSRDLNAQRAKALQALIRCLGAKVLTDEATCRRAGLDNARFIFHPGAVIRAEGPEDVEAVLRHANQYRVPVTVRGAGSSTTGAASPVNEGWALDLRQLDSIEIDSLSGMARVGVGAITEQINQAAGNHGWFYPPDPSSKNYSTIGGNLATNAGGLRGAKYGVTRDSVLALEGYLPTGEFVRWGAPLRKYASGFNIRDLWIGSEGMLGIITAAVLKLIPRPETRETFLLGFSTENKALAAAQQIIGHRLIPSILEFMDRQTVTCALRHRSTHAPPLNPLLDGVLSQFKQRPALLLLELDGSRAGVRSETKALSKILDWQQLPHARAQRDTEAEALWAIRRTCSQAMFQLGNTKLNEDVVVPLAQYQALLAYTLELKKQTGLATPTFGHAADGNFHVHLMFDQEAPEQREKAAAGLHSLMEKVVALGGAITGEHGIGLAKSPFLTLQHTTIEIETMRKIKATLDPQNILNPGKMFEPFNLWEHPRDYVTQFPWDKAHQ